MGRPADKHYCISLLNHDVGCTIRLYGPYTTEQKEQFVNLFPKFKPIIQANEDCNFVIYGWCTNYQGEDRPYTIEEELQPLLDGSLIKGLEKNLESYKDKKTWGRSYSEEKAKRFISEVKSQIRLEKRRIVEAETFMKEVREAGLA